MLAARLRACDRGTNVTNREPGLLKQQLHSVWEGRAMSWVSPASSNSARALNFSIELAELLESKSCHAALALETSPERLSFGGHNASRAARQLSDFGRRNASGLSVSALHTDPALIRRPTLSRSVSLVRSST